MERKPHKHHTTKDRPTDPASWITPLGEMKIPVAVQVITKKLFESVQSSPDPIMMPKMMDTPSTNPISFFIRIPSSGLPPFRGARASSSLSVAAAGMASALTDRSSCCSWLGEMMEFIRRQIKFATGGQVAAGETSLACSTGTRPA